MLSYVFHQIGLRFSYSAKKNGPKYQQCKFGLNIPHVGVIVVQGASTKY